MSEAEDDMRAALDKALKDCLDFTLLDKEGHVDCVDGYIHTGDVAEAILQNLTTAGWSFQSEN